MPKFTNNNHYILFTNGFPIHLAPSFFMGKILTFISTLIILASFISCNHGDQATDQEKKFLDLADIDSTVKPGNNFYSYVNRKWINRTEIPSREHGDDIIFH
jgi:hypothetical protein